jgi:oxygen-independent coproporphyrinogen-3 oxidase
LIERAASAQLDLLPEGFVQSSPVAHLYVHVPFCSARCSYCDFVFFVGREARMADYVQSVEWEIGAAARTLWTEPLRTIHLGGGTPSLLPPEMVARIIHGTRNAWEMVPSAEIALEANPSSTILERARAWRSAGVNRVSLGVQCFDDTLLRSLGRRHGAEGARESFHALRRAGFENINLDLIYALPGMDAALWERTLLEAIDLAPEHISCYCLTLEDGTPLERQVREGRLSAPGEDAALEQLHLAADLLKIAGYQRYEISNWARPGFESRHNLTYWRGIPYYGAGCAAHSYLTLRDGSHTPAAIRFWNASGLEHYIGRAPWARDGEELLSGPLLAADYAMVNLRLRDGIPDWPAPQLGSLSPEGVFGHQLAQLEAAGLLQRTWTGWGPTPRGMDLHNALSRAFLP